MDPNEDSYEMTTKVDQYAFAVLVEDVFRGHNDGLFPLLFISIGIQKANID